MVNEIDIHNFINGGGSDCFSDKLLVLIAKADVWNREKIRKGFPEAVKMFEEYYETGKCPCAKCRGD